MAPKRRITSETARRPARAGVGGGASSVQPSRDSELPYISASARQAFKKCRYAWSWRYINRVEPKVAAPQLRFGTLIHTALEHYYKPGVKRGPHPARVFEKAYEREFGEALTLGFRDDDGKWGDALSLGVDMLEHYVDHYGADDEWEVIAAEQQFKQPVCRPETGVQVGWYVAVLDNVLRHRGTQEIWFRDHKSTSTIDTGYLTMDDQSSGYWTYGTEWLYQQGILKGGQQLAGIEFNFLRKAKRDTRSQNEKGQYLNLNGSVSQKQPPEFFKRVPSFRGEYERQLTRARIVQEILEMQLVRKGTLALLKSPSKMNCKFCDVRDICELHEVGSDWQEFARMVMVPRRKFVREAIEFEHEN